MSKYEFIDFNAHGDDRGSLVSLESDRSIPFEIKRVYYIYGTKKNIRRGFHAHKNLTQVLIPVTGECKVLVDNGYKKENLTLNNRTQGLLIKDLIWHEMYDFSDDCVLMVLASDYYDENDYIRDYDNFMTRVAL